MIFMGGGGAKDYVRARTSRTLQVLTAGPGPGPAQGPWKLSGVLSILIYLFLSILIENGIKKQNPKSINFRAEGGGGGGGARLLRPSKSATANSICNQLALFSICLFCGSVDIIKHCYDDLDVYSLFMMYILFLLYSLVNLMYFYRHCYFKQISSTTADSIRQNHP